MRTISRALSAGMRWLPVLSALLVLAGCGDGPVAPAPSAGRDRHAIIIPVDPEEQYPYEVPVYRWYHQDSGHLFGINPDEGYPFGYVLEHNPSFYLFDTKPSYKYIQIYRCWRHNAFNQHFMTTSSTCDGEANVTREDLEGVYGLRPQYNTTDSGLVPLYRLRYVPNGDDLVTTSEDEVNAVLASGWEYMGILAYVVP